MKEILKSVEVESYNPLWSEVFAKEAIEIQKVLGLNCLKIEHIGSTSVPGLLAKPKIDMGIQANDLIATIKPLETLGYAYDGEWNIPLHIGFSKRGDNNFNLHVYRKNAPSLDGQIIFRDALRKNEQLRLEYSNLKEILLAEPESHQKPGTSMYRGYTLGKNDFIKRILREKGFDRNFIQFCVYQEEHSKALEILAKNSLANENRDLNGSPEFFNIVFYSSLQVIGYCRVKVQGNSLTKELLLIDHSDPIKAVLLKNEFEQQVLDWIDFKQALAAI